VAPIALGGGEWRMSPDANSDRSHETAIRSRPAVEGPRTTPRDYSARLRNALACPACGRTPLEETAGGVRCPRCPEDYPASRWGSLDLRPRRPRRYPVEFEIGDRLPPQAGVDFGRLTDHPSPEVDFSSIETPPHLSRQILSHFPRAREPGALMLGLGCGHRVYPDVYALAGFEYVGLDIEDEAASILGDAHALPFRDESVEFILAMALLEHVRHPAVMMREACRVLKPGGVIMGTVAFMEPFHGDSFYHHTALGTLNTLHAGGLTATHISPVAEWPVLYALADLALFPRMPKVLAKALVLPLHGFHVWWWKLCTRVNHAVPESRRLCNTTGTFIYRAVKETG
jgi:SAM-dependent methyltransferase